MSESTKAMLWSWGRVFLAAVVSAFLAIVTATQAIPTSSDAWMGLLIAGIVAVGPVIYNYLNVNDTRYGRGSE
jgi:hypothetical protein